MQFPENWFEDEVRDGFYVSGIIKREWAAQLELLNQIAMLCERHGLRWSVAYGTMLGAVRHHGYIPWDDDMDLFMPSDDFEKLKEYVPKELPAEFHAGVHDERDSIHQEYLSVIGCNSEHGFDVSYAKTFHEFPFPISIDIFRLGYVSDDEEKEKRRDRCLLLLQDIITIVKGEASGISKPALVNEKTVTLSALRGRSGDTWAEQIIKSCRKLTEAAGKSFAADQPLLQQLYDRYYELSTCFQRKDCSSMAFLPFYTTRGRDRYPVSYFDDLIQLPYENIRVNVLREYDAILRYNYGDGYMTPIKGRSFHNYPAYRMYEKKLTDQSPFQYSFSEKDMAERPADAYSPKKVVSESLSMIHQLHQTLHEIAEKRILSQSFEIFQYCQQLAETIGNAIEKARNEAFLQDLLVEDYAEAVYQCYVITDRKKALEEENLAGLDLSLQKMTEEVRKRFLERREVLFLPCMADRWKALESLWRACMQDSSCDVAVMPLSCFQKHGDGAFEAEPVCDTDRYPEEIHALPYQSYDIRSRHPDYIFIQFPYDLYNYVTSTDPKCYSTVLHPMTEHLVYIPWFQTCEFDRKSQVDVIAMDYYAKVPGVVRADLTVVQSEKIADTYRSVLTEFAGEKTKAVWDRKIQGWGSPLQDRAGTASPLWAKIREYFENN